MHYSVDSAVRLKGHSLNRRTGPVLICDMVDTVGGSVRVVNLEGKFLRNEPATYFDPASNEVFYKDEHGRRVVVKQGVIKK